MLIVTSVSHRAAGCRRAILLLGQAFRRVSSVLPGIAIDTRRFPGVRAQNGRVPLI